MSTAAPAFLLREARPSDRAALVALARELDSINLPRDPQPMRDALERSARAFRGRIRSRVEAVYIFCAEEIATRRIAAASMIIGKHGTPEAPHYYLECGEDERYSHSLRKLFRHPYLRLHYSMDGPTEIGGLIVTKAMRGHPERLGKQISWVRFLYVGRHLERFEPQVVAEMLAPMGPDHGNVLWDHYGRRVTGLSFREADVLSTRDKEFIRALFPETPLYTFMLPEDVRASLGAVGENTRGAVRLLEEAGMHFLKQIDPFDGGPYYGAATADLIPVRALRTIVAVSGEPAPERAVTGILGVDHESQFRAVRATIELLDNDRALIPPAILESLRVKLRAHLDFVPLP